MAMAFAVAGFAARYLLHNKIETRYLILLFCLLAALLEFGIRPAAGRPRNLISFLSNFAAAVIALIAMKWMLEGVHPRLLWLVQGIQQQLA